MRESEWCSDKVFLAEVSTIPFVCAEDLPSLNWIKSIYPPKNRIQQSSDVIDLTCLKGAAPYKFRTLLWTTKPIVRLHCFTSETQVATTDAVLRHMGVITTPNPCDVVKNVKNISESRFSNFALFDKYTDDCKQEQRESDKHCLLLNVLEDNFHFLHQQLSNYSETVLHPLKDVPCIPVCAEGKTSDITKPVLVHPLQVIAMESKECKAARPFISPLPDVLFPFMRGVLSEVGIESTLQPIHVGKALKTIHKYVKQPLDPNTVEVVQYLLKQLYFQLKDCSEKEEYAEVLFPLFLPNEDHMLIQTTHLICNDKHQYRKIPFDFSSLSYSLFSFLSPNPRRELGFTPQQLCNCLPQKVSPILLSSCCEEELHNSCTEIIKSTSTSEKLQYVFHLHMYIARAANLIIQHTVKADVEQDRSKFTTTLQKFLKNTKIVVYKHLQADIFLTIVTPRKLIGTAEVPFLIQKFEEQTFSLCLSEVMPLNLPILLATSVVSCVTQLCGIDSKGLGSPEEVIAKLLAAESLDHIVSILEELDISSDSFRLDDLYVEIPVSSQKPKLGDPVPLEMHHLLDQDINNIFRPEELVGYEEHTDYIIFARVVYRIQKDIEEDEEKEEGFDEYLICTHEDDESGKVVSVLDLYKFARTESMPVVDCCEVAIPEASDVTQLSKTLHDEDWKKIKKEICTDLQRIWRLPEEERRKGIKRLYLKWHPDKNNHKLATEAFKFIKQQISKLELGLNEDQEDEDHPIPSCWRSRWNAWDEIAARHGRSQQRARYGGGGQRSEGWRDGGCRGLSGAGEISSSWWKEMTPKQDISKARVWLQQAEVDLEVLETILLRVNASSNHAGHVCFLAHEVAEKTLKAGKYATCGLHPGDLQRHGLVGHARAMEQMRPQLTSGLSTNALALENYYLETRFPNKYSPAAVPAHHFTPDQAREAQRNAARILQMMKDVIK